MKPVGIAFLYHYLPHFMSPTLQEEACTHACLIEPRLPLEISSAVTKNFYCCVFSVQPAFAVSIITDRGSHMLVVASGVREAVFLLLPYDILLCCALCCLNVSTDRRKLGIVDPLQHLLCTYWLNKPASTSSRRPPSSLPAARPNP